MDTPRGLDQLKQRLEATGLEENDIVDIEESINNNLVDNGELNAAYRNNEPFTEEKFSNLAYIKKSGGQNPEEKDYASAYFEAKLREKCGDKPEWVEKTLVAFKAVYGDAITASIPSSTPDITQKAAPTPDAAIPTPDAPKKPTEYPDIPKTPGFHIYPNPSKGPVLLYNRVNKSRGKGRGGKGDKKEEKKESISTEYDWTEDIKIPAGLSAQDIIDLTDTMNAVDAGSNAIDPKQFAALFRATDHVRLEYTLFGTQRSETIGSDDLSDNEKAMLSLNLDDMGNDKKSAYYNTINDIKQDLVIKAIKYLIANNEWKPTPAERTRLKPEKSFYQMPQEDNGDRRGVFENVTEKYKAFGVTERGTKAPNADTMLVMPERGLYAIASGFGENEDAIAASTQVTHILEEYFRAIPSTATINFMEDTKTAVESTNKALRETNKGKKTPATAALAMVMLQEGKKGLEAEIAYLGLNRVWVYSATKQTLEQITLDDQTELRRVALKDFKQAKKFQSLMDDVIDPEKLTDDQKNKLYESLIHRISRTGERKQADTTLQKYWEGRLQSTNTLGSDSAQTHHKRVSLQPGDRLLMTTPGIHANVTAATMLEALKSGRSVVGTTLAITKEARIESQHPPSPKKAQERKSTLAVHPRANHRNRSIVIIDLPRPEREIRPEQLGLSKEDIETLTTSVIEKLKVEIADMLLRWYRERAKDAARELLKKLRSEKKSEGEASHAADELEAQLREKYTNPEFIAAETAKQVESRLPLALAAAYKQYKQIK